MNTVGGRIQAARLAAGLTQEKLAARIGVTKSSVSQWESGKIDDLKADNLLKLARQTNVSAEWLWEGKDLPMGRPVHLDPDASDLVETFKILPPESRDELLADAHKYLRLAAAQQNPSKQNPFPKARKPVK